MPHEQSAAQIKEVFIDFGKSKPLQPEAEEVEVVAPRAVTDADVSLLLGQKLGQNTEKLSEPLLLPQELRG